MKSFSKNEFAISMSGGSLGCLAYASFVETLKEEFGLEASLFAGLSGGSAIAPMISAGMSKEKIYEVIKHLSLTKIINMHITHLELLDHRKFIDFIRKNLPVKTFEDSKIPILIFVTNVKKQTTEVIESGDLASAICASCSVYPLFKPVKRLGKLLTDGGFTTYYGARFIRERGVHKIVGVDVTGVNEGTTPRFLKSFYMSLNSSITSNSRYELEKYPVDIDIRLDVTTPTIFTLNEKIEEVFRIGQKAAREYHAKIKKLTSDN